MRNLKSILWIVFAVPWSALAALQSVRGEAAEDGAVSLQGTEATSAEVDTLPQEMLDGIHRFLRRLTADASQQRTQFWQRDLSSPEAYERSVSDNRERLRQILGVVDERTQGRGFDLVATTRRPAEIARHDQFVVYRVRWAVFGGIEGEGLLLEPTAGPTAQIVLLPDADQTPEELLNRDDSVGTRLAAAGCRVVIPVLISRDDQFSGNAHVNRFTNQPHREWIHRQAYQLGRHVIGFEVQKVLAAVDRFEEFRQERESARPLPIGVAGYGEGGLVAFYAAALDRRIDVALVSGYFGPREGLAEEPIYRNVWGLLREFGDAEIAGLVVPRSLVVETAPPPQVTGPPEPRDGRRGAAPGAIPQPSNEAAAAEFARAAEFVGGELSRTLQLVSGEGVIGFGSADAVAALLAALEIEDGDSAGEAISVGLDPPEVEARQQRQVRQMEDYVQHLLQLAPFARGEFFWKPVRSRAAESGRGSSAADWDAAVEPLREVFRKEFIGEVPEPLLPDARPRSRRLPANEGDTWTRYLLILDVWPDVIAWGYLLVPDDIEPGERRATVVCQHGLGGSPDSVIDPDNRAYRGYAAELARQGYVVYCPYNPNAVPGDINFRQLQRWANPLKCSIFSVITGQHEQTLRRLTSLPFVDAERIGFYGLSYGGKTAMRVPAVLKDYSLSICSGDFNQWATKIVTPLGVTNAAADSMRFSSYMFTAEYEIMEFNQANTFDYAEMAAMIAPRPFMVERGSRDLVGSDEWVAFEYAGVRRLYGDLGIGRLTEIEFFDDGHVINGEGTYRFLQEHLAHPGKSR